MDKKWLKWKSGPVFIAGVLMILSLCACSKLKSLVADSNLNGVGQQESVVSQKELASFVSSVRPQQENAESILKRARYFQKVRKYRLAIQEFNAVLSMDPNDVQAYNSMGICYDLLGDYDRAVYSYKKALALNPCLAYVQNNLGYSYYLQGNLDSAIETFKKAIDLDARKALYHNNLGLAYAEKGLFQPAFEQFTLSGGETKAHYNLAQIYSSKGLDAEAKTHLALAKGAIRPLPSSDPVDPNIRASTEPYLHAPEGMLSDFASSAGSEKLSSPGQVISRVGPVPANTGSEPLSSSGMEHGLFTVQVASCRLRTSAETAQRSIEALGYPSRILETAGQDKWYVVRTSPFNDLNQAETAARELKLILGEQTILIRETEELVEATPGVEAKERAKSSDSKNISKGTKEYEPLIEVSNGNGIRFMARDVSRYLGNRGYTVQRLTNAETFSLERTTIYYCDGYLDQAYRLAEEMPGWNELQKVRRLRSPAIKVRLVIGKDLVLFRGVFGNV
jgi:Flp pilus assembly protein TadD